MVTVENVCGDRMSACGVTAGVSVVTGCRRVIRDCMVVMKGRAVRGPVGVRGLFAAVSMIGLSGGAYLWLLARWGEGGILIFL